MARYFAKRLGISVIIIFLVSLFAFSLMHILPGDPARLVLGEEASQEDVDELRAQLNLDKPLVTQYFYGFPAFSVVTSAIPLQTTVL